MALAALLVAGCSYTWAGAEPKPSGDCPNNGWLAGTDIVLGTGAGVTGAVAAYPCFGDVEQRDSVRVVHCSVAVAGIVGGVIYALSARSGLRARKRCLVPALERPAQRGDSAAVRRPN